MLKGSGRMALVFIGVCLGHYLIASTYQFADHMFGFERTWQEQKNAATTSIAILSLALWVNACFWK